MLPPNAMQCVAERGEVCVSGTVGGAVKRVRVRAALLVEWLHEIRIVCSLF